MEHSGPGFKILGDFCYTVVERSLQEDVMLVSDRQWGNRSQLSPVFPTSLDKVADMVRNYLGSFSPSQVSLVDAPQSRDRLLCSPNSALVPEGGLPTHASNH